KQTGSEKREGIANWFEDSWLLLIRRQRFVFTRMVKRFDSPRLVLRLTQHSMAINRIEGFCSVFSREIFNFLDPHCEFERRGSSHCCKAWSLRPESKFESLI